MAAPRARLEPGTRVRVRDRTAAIFGRVATVIDPAATKLRWVDPASVLIEVEGPVAVGHSRFWVVKRAAVAPDDDAGERG